MTTTKSLIPAEDLSAQVKQMLESLSTDINPQNVKCMMGIVVSQLPEAPVDEDGDEAVHLTHFAIGSEADIKRMMLFMLEGAFGPSEDDSEERMH
jgi:hypothetical protein